MSDYCNGCVDGCDDCVGTCDGCEKYACECCQTCGASSSTRQPNGIRECATCAASAGDDWVPEGDDTKPLVGGDVLACDGTGRAKAQERAANIVTGLTGNYKIEER